MAEQNYLREKDLIVDEVYPGGAGLVDEPIRNLLGVGNMGGIRPRVDATGQLMYVVLYSTGDQPEWPDQFDSSSATFTYFGDNRSPGQDLLRSPGNRILDRVARLDLETREGRAECPPLFIFHLARGYPARSVSFRGLAVPGRAPLSDGNWCSAKYFDSGSGKYLNFEIQLTILNDRVVRRSWLDGLGHARKLTEDCPKAFRTWMETGEYLPFEGQGKTPPGWQGD